jgi:hypothetical protein
MPVTRGAAILCDMALHLDIPTSEQLNALLDAREPGSVSAYLPTSPLPQDAEAARIELKNLAAEAQRQLGDAGRGVREQFEALLGDDAFWAHLANSLAVFATADSLRTFRLPNRLVSMVEVSDRFHLKPLLRSVTFPQAALVLALTQNSVRLIEVAADAPPSEVEVAELPTPEEIADRLRPGHLQDAEKVRMRQYARLVDSALRPVLAGLGLPLILATTEPLDSIYRSLNSYPRLAARGVPGNPEAVSDAELAAAAREILDELYAAQLDGVRATFRARSDAGRGATDITDVARAATFGAVDTLLVDIDDVIPGFVSEDDGTVTLEGDNDAVNYGVVDEIARRVLLSGGRVLALRREDIPGQGTAAAILRYPV